MTGLSSTLIEALISALLVFGGFFGLLGSFSVVRLRDPLQRLHGPTKATTIGIGTALVASALSRMLVPGGAFSWQELAIVASLLITAPLSTLFMSKAHIFKTIDRSTLPATGTGAPWATLDAPDGPAAKS